MKKLAILSAGAALLLYAVPAFANKPNGPAAYNGLNKGNSEVQHLELYEKDANWQPVKGGAWGKMTFDSDSYVFNGHGLEPNTKYALVVYDQDGEPDAWPGSGPRLGTGMTNAGGNLNLSGELVALNQAKVWLVLASDVNAAGNLTAWHPSDYLFEYNKVTN